MRNIADSSLLRVFGLSVLLSLVVATSQAAAPLQAPDLVTTPGQSVVVTSTTSYVQLPADRSTGLQALPADITGAVATAETTETVAFDPARMIDVSEIRPGMKGYGLTVFSGLRPEKFEVEVVGVRHRTFADGDMVLCRLIHPILKDIGVVAGMSGSPVYVNERLVGAVAYGWTFSREALAGVTPIRDMLRVYNTTYPGLRQVKDAGTAATQQAFNAYAEMRRTRTFQPYMKAARTAAVQVSADDVSPGMRSSLPASFEMQPLSTPIFVSSANPRTLAILREVFSCYGSEPVAASGGGSPGGAQADNAPGGPMGDLSAFATEMSGGYGVAIPFVQGDVTMAGVGTVSFRQGNKLVAFGHPMFEQGVSDYPMAAARIIDIVKSIQRPMKLGEPIGDVGMILQDRLPAVAGVFGMKPSLFAVRATIEDANYQAHREYNYKVWDDRDFGPMMTMSVLLDSLSGAARSGGETAALVDYTLVFDEGTSFSKQDYIVDQEGGYGATMTVGAELGMMMNNVYKRVRPKSVEFKMQLSDRFPKARIRAAQLDKAWYKPGDKVTLTWDVEPFRKSVQQMSYSFTLPSNTPEGDYSVTVSDAGSRESQETMLNPGGSKIQSFETLLKSIRRNFPSNMFYVTVQDRDTGVAVHGSELPKLPGSVISTIQGTVDEQYFAPVRGNFVVDADIVSNYEISGSDSVPLRVMWKNN